MLQAHKTIMSETECLLCLLYSMRSALSFEFPSCRNILLFLHLHFFPITSVAVGHALRKCVRLCVFESVTASEHLEGIYIN